MPSPPSRSVVGTWLMIVRLLTPAEQRRGLALGLLLALNALVDAAGVASILPFLAVLGNPSMVETQPLLRSLYTQFAFTSADRFALFLGLASLSIVFLGGLVRLVAEYWSARFVELRRHSLGCRLLAVYLRQPYAFFLTQHSADLSKILLSEVDHAVAAALVPALRIPAYLFVCLALVILLLIVDPIVAVTVALVVGLSYGGLYAAVTGTIRRRGRDRARVDRLRFETAAEAFGGIKELKLLGREAAYIDRFVGPSRRYSEHQATIRTVSMVPKHVIEMVGFGGILGLTLSHLAMGHDLSRILPVLGLYALAGYRLLPAAQNLYANFANLRFGAPAAEVIHRELSRLSRSDEADARAEPRVRLEHALTWERVSFTYPEAAAPALVDVSLTIPARQTVAVVGTTGAGKTTVLDLLLGLLRPDQGRILIDGAPLHETGVRAWQRSLGYAPQHVFLTDDTVAANIAFGVPPADVDRDAVMRAARLACLDDIIDERGLETPVGERGIRLSGGQRQRLGIARALYHDPDVLVLDEATSALDTRTEQRLMANLRTLAASKTIVLVTHRMTTVRDADHIFLLDGGRLVDAGTFEALINRNLQFRELAAGATQGVGQ